RRPRPAPRRAPRAGGPPPRPPPAAAPECRWVFYDRAPSSNGLWCDMDVCGARHKMRAYRARGGAAARRDA
ncbi:CGNR zinc finger domain-containing protein, partial [Streptomyces anulatus]|uniref:CGNR zinc finger domain-containing protein n=1 Tax=Streptomyces anulatus TaxID=1892 RepID=UPI003663B44E